MNTIPARSRNSDWAIDVSPWPEPVDAVLLLDDLATLVRRFVVLPEYADSALALWILHTYAFELRDVTAYVGIESPEKRCGKTTLLTVLGELVNRPIISSNISSPAFFRVIEELRPTLLIDEADTFLQGNDELRGILNSGYTRKTAFVVRVSNQPSDKVGQASRLPSPHSASDSKPGDGVCNHHLITSIKANTESPLPKGEGQGEGKGTVIPPTAQSTVVDENLSTVSEPETRNPKTETQASTLARFSSWCPKAMAAIGRLPDTLADRCIAIRMERKTTAENCERLKNLDAIDLKQKCTRFIADHTTAILTAVPSIPDTLNDRAADIWEPLLVLADLAGGPWPQRARHAAIHLTTRAQETNPIGSLLIDIWVAISATETGRIFSRDLVRELNDLGDRPWSEMHKGKPITELWISQQLRPYHVRPRMLWINNQCARGYVLGELLPIFRRYIPTAELETFKAEHTRPNSEQPPQAA